MPDFQVLRPFAPPCPSNWGQNATCPLEGVGSEPMPGSSGWATQGLERVTPVPG